MGPSIIDVLVGTSTGLGFNPFNAIAKGASAVANTAVRVAQDPRAQNIALVAAKSYAPGQVAAVTQKAQQIQQVLHPPGPGRPAPRPAMPMPMPMVDPDSGLPPAHDNHLLLWGAAGVGAIVLIMLLKR